MSADIKVIDMSPDEEYFVGTCTHTGESAEIDAAAKRRLAWLKRMSEVGLRIKVALYDSVPAGFLYLMPIEICPWGPLGNDLMISPCLFVMPEFQGKCIGKYLVDEAEQETIRQQKKGLVISAYFNDFWFMPGAYFISLGFREINRQGTFATLWKVFDKSAIPPVNLQRQYSFQPRERQVVVDLFSHSFCLTANIEAARVREVTAEFGERVQLNESTADNPEILRRFQIPRAIFIEGNEIGWGYEAPREEIRKAINQAMINKGINI